MALKVVAFGLVIATFLLLQHGSYSKDGVETEETVDSIKSTKEYPAEIESENEKVSQEVEILYQWTPSKCDRKVQSGDFVRYHYYGMLSDGTRFDDSYARGGTYNTYVESGWLIKGMDQALLGMCIHEHRLVSIPPHLAYGEEGTDDIPGGATIFFNFILVDISNPDDKVQIISTYLPDDCERKLEDTDFVSYDDGRSYDTYVGQGWLIQGMDVGLTGSCMGEKRTIIIPPHMGYGDKGDGKNIPPSAVIKFEVEILDFHNPKDEAVTTTLDSKFGKKGDEQCPRYVEETDFVRYRYNGTLVDGTVFDSSYARGGTYDTYVGKGRLIAGVDRGLLGTCVGETRRIVVPPHLGYGEAGVEEKIPGSAVILFDVYLVDVHNPKDEVAVTVVKDPPLDCKRKTKTDDYLTLNYDLGLMDGTDLDSSHNHQGTFGVYNRMGDLIIGLHRGVEGMCAGEIRKIIVPPHLGFGEQGSDSLPDGVLFMWSEGRSESGDLLKITDDDSDGKVSLDEFMSYILKQVDSGNAKLVPGREREKVVEELFAIMDKDADGFLQSKECKIPDGRADGEAREEL